MKERPILFSGPMVRALLAGTKTQTRRVWKMPRGCEWYPEMGGEAEGWFVDPDQPWWLHVEECRPPHGRPGDRLWVREAFDFLPSGGPDQPQACEIVYWATGSTEPRSAPLDYNPMIYGHQKVRPSIHMPRWASRITLEITSVRVERLQDISIEDAKAEGAWGPDDSIVDKVAKHFGIDVFSANPRKAFQMLWEQINGPGSWAENPWVWVVEFNQATPTR